MKKNKNKKKLFVKNFLFNKKKKLKLNFVNN